MPHNGGTLRIHETTTGGWVAKPPPPPPTYVKSTLHPKACLTIESFTNISGGLRGGSYGKPNIQIKQRKHFKILCFGYKVMFKD